MPKNTSPAPVIAVYVAREDGDYDFAAAFANDDRWDECPAETYAESLRDIGEEAIVREFDDMSHLVDVLTVEE